MAEAATLQRTEDAKNGTGLLSRVRGLFGKPAAAETDEGGQGDDDEKKKGRSTWWRLKPVTLLCLAVLAGALVIRIWDPDFVEGLRVKTFDLYQRLEPRPVKPYPVAIIDIDEKSLAEIGQWPWSRSVIGNLITQAAKQGAAVVGFDVVFAEYDRMSPKTAAASFSGLTEEIKKALIELAPLRWDESSGRLLLARRLTVRVNFKGRERSEIATGRGKGRRHVKSQGSRQVLARFATREPGLYGARFEDVFGRRVRSAAQYARQRALANSEGVHARLV